MLGAPVRRDGPHDFLLAEVLGYTNAIDESLPPREEEGRLARVRSAEFDRVVGSGRNREILLPVAIEIAEHQIEGAVGIPDPPLEIRDDALTGVEADIRQ